MKTFAVTVRIRNNCLLQRRTEAGLSQPQLAAAAGVSLTRYREYEQMRRSPLIFADRRGFRKRTATLEERQERKQRAQLVWAKDARQLAAYYGVLEEELWPNAVLAVKQSEMTRLLDPEEITPLLQPPEQSAEHLLVEDETRSALRAALQELDPREQRVLQLRYGLDEGREHLLEEVGDILGVSRERARQIECAALRKVRKQVEATR